MTDIRVQEILRLLDAPAGRPLWHGGATPLGSLRGVSPELAAWKPYLGGTASGSSRYTSHTGSTLCDGVSRVQALVGFRGRPQIGPRCLRYAMPNHGAATERCYVTSIGGY